MCTCDWAVLTPGLEGLSIFTYSSVNKNSQTQRASSKTTSLMRIVSAGADNTEDAKTDANNTTDTNTNEIH